jgi:hypothetical protein
MAATITVVPTVTPGAFKAEIRIHSTQGDRVWRVDMGSWHNYFVLPARLPRIAVRYGEAEAEFGTGGDMTITVDASGTLSFRSTQTGCVGLGTVAPYGDGRNQIYEVRLDVSDCAGSRAYLVGRYSGLATSAPSDPWNYDSNLRMWLSSTDAGRPVAVTTWGLMEY